MIKSCFILFIFLAYQSTVMAQEHNGTDEAAPIRVAAFNIGLDQARQVGELAKLLQPGDYIPALKSAEIIQRVRPDVLLINEIDGNDEGKTLAIYIQQYLARPQSDQVPIEYPYVYQPTCNTGLSSGISFRDEPDKIDNFGFGHYDGQYCMALLSRYPIETRSIHSFQKFLWQDLPGALLPALNGESWYSKAGLNAFRLSSKNHVDVPVNVDGKKVHLLISHPTPPVFDGEEDRNGTRNHDEIKFWQHYVNGGIDWLQNDKGHSVSGLNEYSRFVIMGDLNASTVEGDAKTVDKVRAITALLHDPLVAAGFSELQDAQHIPKRTGGLTPDSHRTGSQSKFALFHTAQWRMRADYVVPSRFGLDTIAGGVYWPGSEDEEHSLVTITEESPSSSDHRLVWLDVRITED